MLPPDHPGPPAAVLAVPVSLQQEAARVAVLATRLSRLAVALPVAVEPVPAALTGTEVPSAVTAFSELVADRLAAEAQAVEQLAHALASAADQYAETEARVAGRGAVGGRPR